MIITLTKADFSSCKIGTLTTFNVRKSTTIGATVNIIKTSVERAGYSSATTIATIILDEANYEGHAIKVMMGSTDVSSWYSVGNVIVPANTPITSNITISVSATAVSGGDPIIPDEPEQPGTGGGNTGGTTWYIQSLKQLEESGNTFEKKVHLGPAASYAWAFNTFNSKLSGHTINTIRMMIGKASTSSTENKFYIGVYDPETYQVTDTRIIDTSGAEVDSIQTYTFDNLTIPNGKYFTWNCSYTGAAERSGYYILKANLDPLAVETSTWYQAYKDKMTEFGTHELVFLADIGYTDSGNGGSTPSEPSTPELPENSEWYIKSLSELESTNNNYKSTGVNLTPNPQYAWAFQEELNNDIVGKTINATRLYIDKQGSTKKFTVGVYDPDTHKVTDIREITIDDAHVGTVQLYKFNALTIPSGKFFVWNCTMKSGESSGRYVLEEKLDKSKVKTSGWYFAKSSAMEKFSNYRLVFVADFGYIVE
jgi:hypothetical protein